MVSLNDNDKEDLRREPEDSLMICVFQDDGLFVMHNSSAFRSILSELYLFTPRQWKVLQDAIEDEKRLAGEHDE